MFQNVDTKNIGKVKQTIPGARKVITLFKGGKEIGEIPLNVKPERKINADSVIIHGVRYELKRSYAGKQGAIGWASEIRRDGYYPNRVGLARVFRLMDGGWGVFVGYGAYKKR